ncbi:MAG: monothiol glutaredoxin [bacterium]|jgi:monothiol glutaredoxin
MATTNEVLLSNEITEANAKESIDKQLQENELLIYMKGNSMMPQCGFSSQVVEIFNRLGVDYTTANVLSNPAIRDGIKAYSNWPTIPQVYYKQKFIGGCDIVTEMYQSGEMDKLLGLVDSKE